MGTQLALSYANLYMGEFETKRIGGEKFGADLVLYGRYIDYLFIVWKGNPLTHHGDIYVKLGRSAISCTNCLWLKSSTDVVTVPYVIASDYTADERELIIKSMEELMTMSCIRFVERETETDYIDIFSESSCWSVVGRSRGKQKLSLASQNCMVHGVIQHELMHALGFVHEINRSDRDNYIIVLEENIIPGDTDLFSIDNTNNLGLPYDYDSVMHYSRYAFTSNGKETIVPKLNTSVVLGQRFGVSTLDVAKLNKLYDCNLCRTLLDGTSGALTSTNYPSPYPSDSSCLYLIRVNENQVSLVFQDFDMQSSTDCTSDYLRVYDGPNTSSPVLLDKVCGNELPPSLVSSTNTMLLEFVSGEGGAGTGFKASYSQVPEN
ncbi:embryonic protein UVS.2-like [Mixophyes fleayi]|uniref:embryonic protein UVS.2-like n=1 Tax=Mixophyes fleayi TaxID=3061075 RepID=UPI003F4D9AE5